MSCENVNELITSLLDRQIAGEEREHALEHFEICRRCSVQYQSARNLRAALRERNEPPMPAVLQAKLKVLASHERVRHLAQASLSARVQYWRSRVKLQFENLMRPVALPIAGGLISAGLMFAVLLPNISFAHNFVNEPPTEVFTNPDGQVVGMGDMPRLEPVGFVTTGARAVVELTIDPKGRVRNYTLTQGTWTPGADQLHLASSHFTPGYHFRPPILGKIAGDFECPFRTSGANCAEWRGKDSANIFSIKGSALERIAEAACALPEDPVIEIGPGRGALTEKLLARSERRDCD